MVNESKNKKRVSYFLFKRVPKIKKTIGISAHVDLAGCSAEIEKSHSKAVLDALLELEYVQQIQLDEVMQLQPPVQFNNQ